MQKDSITNQKVLMALSSIYIEGIHCSLDHSRGEELATSEAQVFARSADSKRHTSAINPCCCHTVRAQCSSAQKVRIFCALEGSQTVFLSKSSPTLRKAIAYLVQNAARLI